jgi:hypothetical protein
MIEPHLLRQLGFSEELVAEVTRVAVTVRRAAAGIRPLSMRALVRRSASGSALAAEERRTETVVWLSVNPHSEPSVSRSRYCTWAGSCD